MAWAKLAGTVKEYGPQIGETEKKAKVDTEFHKFLEPIRDEKCYKQVLDAVKTSPSKNRLDEDFEHRLCAELCRLCWETSRKEIESLKKKLSDLNLNSMKQVSALKAAVKNAVNTKDASEEDAEELITAGDLIDFYEPLSYMDDSMQQLVISLASDTCRRLAHGTARASMMQATGVKEPIVGGGAWKKKCEKAEKRIRELEDKLEDVQQSLQIAEETASVAQQTFTLQQDELTKAREATSELQNSLHDKEQEVILQKAEFSAQQKEFTQMQHSLFESRDKEQQLQVQIEKLTEENNVTLAKCQTLNEEWEQKMEEQADLRWQLEQDLEGMQVLKEENEALQERLRQKADIQEEAFKQQIEVLEKKVDELETQLQDLENQLQATKSEVEDVTAKYEASRKEAGKIPSLQERIEDLVQGNKKLDDSLKSSNAEVGKLRARVHELETAPPPPPVVKAESARDEKIREENKRLKTMLEELKQKVRDLQKQLHLKLGDNEQVRDIFKDAGLEALVQVKTVFDRLYDDAMTRVAKAEAKMKKIQNKQQEEREKVLGVTTQPPSIMQELEANQVKEGLMKALHNSTIEKDVRREQARLDQEMYPQRHLRPQWGMGGEMQVNRLQGRVSVAPRQVHPSGSPREVYPSGSSSGGSKVMYARTCPGNTSYTGSVDIVHETFEDQRRYLVEAQLKAEKNEASSAAQTRTDEPGARSYVEVHAGDSIVPAAADEKLQGYSALQAPPVSRKSPSSLLSQGGKWIPATLDRPFQKSTLLPDIGASPRPTGTIAGISNRDDCDEDSWAKPACLSPTATSRIGPGAFNTLSNFANPVLSARGAKVGAKVAALPLLRALTGHYDGESDDEDFNWVQGR